MSYPQIRQNPRFKKNFTVTIIVGEIRIQGQAVEPSAFGSNVEISEYEYKTLSENRSLWENGREISVSTTFTDAPAAINNLIKNTAGEHLVSLKLLKGRSWYS